MYHQSKKRNRARFRCLLCQSKSRVTSVKSVDLYQCHRDQEDPVRLHQSLTNVGELLKQSVVSTFFNLCG